MVPHQLRNIYFERPTSPLKFEEGEEKANRYSCQIKNHSKPLKTLDITFF